MTQLLFHSWAPFPLSPTLPTHAGSLKQPTGWPVFDSSDLQAYDLLVEWAVTAHRCCNVAMYLLPYERMVLQRMMCFGACTLCPCHSVIVTPSIMRAPSDAGALCLTGHIRNPGPSSSSVSGWQSWCTQPGRGRAWQPGARLWRARPCRRWPAAQPAPAAPAQPCACVVR